MSTTANPLAFATVAGRSHATPAPPLESPDL